jgi:hypothetical protein
MKLFISKIRIKSRKNNVCIQFFLNSKEDLKIDIGDKNIITLKYPTIERCLESVFELFLQSDKEYLVINYSIWNY